MDNEKPSTLVLSYWQNGKLIAFAGILDSKRQKSQREFIVKQSRSNNTHPFIQQLRGLHAPLKHGRSSLLLHCRDLNHHLPPPGGWPDSLGCRKPQDRAILLKRYQKGRDFRVLAQGVQPIAGTPTSILVLQSMPPLCDFSLKKRNIFHFRSVRMNHVNALDGKYTSLILI